ncbi:MAG TPA: hypothetical protein VF720_08790 [Candidatus Eisenbacteria bacterium]
MPRTLTCFRTAAALFPALLSMALAHPADAANCGNTSTGMIPIIDLGPATYQGFQGGLYPGGVNFRPSAHESAGVAIAQSVTRLNKSGDPDPQGKIVMASIGMSNCYLEYGAFKNYADGYPGVNWGIQFVNLAQGGQVAETICNPNAEYWDYVDQQLWWNDVTAEQIQVVFFKNANRSPDGGFPGQAQTYGKQVGDIMHILHDTFPNLKQVFITSRTYGGYASIPLNPEPYAYESGFGIKWLIEAQIAGEDSLNFDPAQGPVRCPWLSWGPYLWADGENPRSDGLTWPCSMFDSADGTHPNPAGQAVVAQIMTDWFLGDTASSPWFYTAVSGVPAPVDITRPFSSPLPARARTTLTWNEATPPSEVSIFDVTGRRVRQLVGATDRWDLSDDAGCPVPDGIYWARPSGAGPERTARIVVQRN